MNASVVLVGCGNMGGALLAGWRDHCVSAERVRVVEPDVARASAARERFGVSVVAAPDEIDGEFAADVVVLAVKPQAIDSVLPAYRACAARGTLIVSIVAGQPVAAIVAAVGVAPVVRAMPNTPAAVRAGITVACANALVSAAQRTLADELLGAVGEVAWVEDEALIDAVTAVSGSGPAYVFLLAECLADAGVAAGLPAPLAARLARRTIIGAGRLLDQSPETPADLRRNVTSPGGTTEAALSVLMADDGLRSLLESAVLRATKRSRELACSATPTLGP